MPHENSVKEFLIKHRLCAQQYDGAEIINAFLDEMTRGLAGKSSSLAMISSYVPVPRRAPHNEKIIVLDAGGTNFRTALIVFDQNSKPNIEYFTNNPMPGIAGELSKEEFFNHIVDYIAPVISSSDRLGFCFSYPTFIDKERDGKLLFWTKEVKAPQIVGEKILFNLSQTLVKRAVACPRKMLILNDTVASLLAGVTSTRFSWDYDYIGFILGTGTNISYIESNKNILKETGLNPAESQAINVESANFNKFERGDIDEAFDRTTASPGKYIIEKMISGAYLGGLCHHIILTAAAEGLISEQGCRVIKCMKPMTTPQLDPVLSDAPSCLSDATAIDRSIIKSLISETIERAALFTAINLTAAILKSNGSKGAKKFCVSADGSVYFKMYSFRQRAEKHLESFAKTYSFAPEIVHVDDAPLIGTAVAVLAI
jgi:hexokinase